MRYARAKKRRKKVFDGYLGVDRWVSQSGGRKAG